MQRTALPGLGVPLAVLSRALRSALCALGRLPRNVAARYRQARDADSRAEALLRSLLTPAQYAELLSCGYLDVASPTHPGRIYRIPRDGSQLILFEHGRAVSGLCVQAVEPIPVADIVAVRKLMIEGAETEFMRRANRVSIAGSYR